MQHEVVDINKWISFKEFMDIVAVSQITPGPISINLATHVGYRIGGALGSTIATSSVVLPSIIIVSIIVLIGGLVFKIGSITLIILSGVAGAILYYLI